MRETTPVELEYEWPELGRGAGGDTGEPLWGAPVLLLYIGLMLGPWATVLLAIFLAKGELGYRNLGIIIGACGTAWCVSQGLTAYFGMSLEFVEIQVMRSALNFCAGIVTYIVARQVVLSRYVTTPKTVLLSVVLVLLMSALTVLASPRVMLLVGR